MLVIVNHVSQTPVWTPVSRNGPNVESPTRPRRPSGRNDTEPEDRFSPTQASIQAVVAPAL